MKRNKSFESNNPLYLIATPIGNLKEFSTRALEIITDADLIACEDTRNTQLLLSHFNIKKHLISLREHNEKATSINIAEQIKNGKKVCYMSDAGYPAISDPGNILAKECIANDIAVSFISGSSAFIGALICSGMDTSHFYFHGFLSSKITLAEKELSSLTNKKETLIFYESPHRIEDTLKLLNKVFGNREIVIARELTKINEEFIHLSLNEIDQIDVSSLKGEMVIIVEGNKIEEKISTSSLVDEIKILSSKGLSKKDIVDFLVKTNKCNKNEAYDLVQNTLKNV